MQATFWNDNCSINNIFEQLIFMRITKFLPFVAVLSMVFMSFTPPVVEENNELEWHTNANEAAKLSMELNRPIMAFLQEVTGVDGV